ncbi:hypothetical protein AVEN_91795-1 [Araneus ventricosus]|uniref:Uncharacterized protein n=1 Tax=Araneus ventricosus TaxID=182803 RepID=A0A4Y2QY40_ARAVE|nr:hypothetical protein AVEN_91795-1 [Araneus ventricosus]
MRSRKQTERQQLLMESSLVYPRGKEKKSNKLKGRTKRKEKKTLGYLGVVNPVTPKEDVPLRGPHERDLPIRHIHPSSSRVSSLIDYSEQVFAVLLTDLVSCNRTFLSVVCKREDFGELPRKK